MPRSRRALLETAGLTLAGASLASVAGCVDRLSNDTGEKREESSPTDRPNRPTPRAFPKWLPDPTTSVVRDGLGIRYFDVDAIREQRDAIHENAYARLETEMLGPVIESVDTDAVDASLAIDFTADLAFGSFDPESVGERITSHGGRSTATSTRTPREGTRTPWPEPKRYRGFDLYGTDYVYAVSEDVVMRVHPFRDDAVEHATAVIDAPTDTSRYTDVNDYAADMLGLVDEPHALWCYTEAMDGSTSRGFRKDVITGGLKSWRFGPETTQLTYANTYLDTEAAESGELAAFVESKSDRFRPYDGLDVAVDDRMAWTDGTIPTNEFDHLSAGGPGDSVSTPN